MTAPATTTVAVLTPSGRGAVAVVRTEGPQALAVVDAALHRPDGRTLTDFPLGRVVVGHWATAAGEEVVVCRFSDDTIEVHCHGGAAAVEAVVARLLDGGCSQVTWQESILRGSPDLIRSAAQIALASAPTARTASILLDQFDGALKLAIDRVVVAAANSEWDGAITTLDSMLRHAKLGLHLTQPWRVVIAGRPNVGKSSLLNALVGFERAIVYDMPGTTRDVVTANTAIDGWPVLLADTAGLREASDTIEAAGVARANAAAADADLVLLVDDLLADGESKLVTESPVLCVLNKIDLHAPLSPHDRQRFDACVSATRNEGMRELLAAIGRALVPSPPATGEAVPFTQQQIAALAAARDAAQQRDLPALQRCLQSLLA
jgi:tRNA modification GTPase